MQRCVYFRDDEDFRKKYVVFTTIFPSSEEARWCFQVQFSTWYEHVEGSRAIGEKLLKRANFKRLNRLKFKSKEEKRGMLGIVLVLQVLLEYF